LRLTVIGLCPEPSGWYFSALVLIGLALSAATVHAGEDARGGRKLYVDGTLANGTALLGARDGGGDLAGAAAACVNCHRRSGLGSYEGNVLIPPIIGPYLFRDRTTNTQDLTLPHVPGFTPNLLPYDDRSLALALRTGVAPGGRTLGALMPRFALDDSSMADLIDYLRHLSVGTMPGVGIDSLDFATVVTPDSDPVDRAQMLEVLEKFFRFRNADVGPRVQSLHPSAVEYRASRSWRLQVWELEGPANTWERQLRERQTAHPVFAVISGLGRDHWAPVHAFCEHEHVPCLLPNIDVPPVAEQDFYPLYYSRGVLLEADLIRARLASHLAASRSRLVQVYRAQDIGAHAAAALGKAAIAAKIKVETRLLGSDGSATGHPIGRYAEIRRALDGLQRNDTLVLWLRPADVAALGDHVPTAEVFMSGLMADLENAPMPMAWRRAVRMTYPFDPPDLRRVRMNFPHAWLRSQGIRLTNDRLQSDTYLACRIVAEAIDTMLDSFVPEFLVERLESMLDLRLATGYYPRLSLASRQRFASKGGYFVKFGGPDAGRPDPDGNWIVP
jgi:hypothetical protein